MKKRLIVISGIIMLGIALRSYIQKASQKLNVQLKNLNVKFSPNKIDLDMWSVIESPYPLAINLRIYKAELKQLGRDEVIGKLAFPITQTIIKGQNQVFSSYEFDRDQLPNIVHPLQLTVWMKIFGIISYTHTEIVNIKI